MSEPASAPALGTVVRQDAKGVLVLLDEGVELWCAVRGRVHMEGPTSATTTVAVGDRVHVRRGAGRRGEQAGKRSKRAADEREDRGAVEAVLARRSVLSRPDPHHERRQHVLASNVDQIVVVASSGDPPFNAQFVDRVLAVAEWSRLPSVVVANKMDLVETPPVELETYRRLGHVALTTSAKRGDGVEDLRLALVGRESVVTGHSGVGKSSLLNAIEPGLALKVGAVNRWTGRGRQTTSAAVRVPLAGGGAIVDTPGVREFGLFNVPRREITWLFRDLRDVAPRCRFGNCLHTGEPGCAVAAAIESGEIAAWRFESYLRLLETAPTVKNWEIAREGQRSGSRPESEDDEESSEARD